MPINYKEYPANWKQLRREVLERADNCCEFCGVENYSVVRRFGKGLHDWCYVKNTLKSPTKLTKIVLTVAHLDHDKHNHAVSIDRLRALCQRCHLAYDLKHRIDKLHSKIKQI